MENLIFENKICHYIDQLEKANPAYSFHFTRGKKYYRIYHTYKGAHDGYESAFCFVDRQGNLYKAEGWARPAKGIRGTLDKPILFLDGFYRN